MMGSAAVAGIMEGIRVKQGSGRHAHANKARIIAFAIIGPLAGIVAKIDTFCLDRERNERGDAESCGKYKISRLHGFIQSLIVFGLVYQAGSSTESGVNDT